MGIDTLALNATQTNERMEAMREGFESGALQPFEVASDAVFTLEQAVSVYKEVLSGAKRRVVFHP